MALDRVSVSVGWGASPASAGVPTTRHIIVGQTGMGPLTPVVVDNLGSYQALYGGRTQGAAMWDAAEFLLSQQAGPIVVQRATGPAATKATVALGTSAISVTAKLPGALSGWTAQYTTATKTVTLVKGAGATPVRYTGGTAAELEAAASVDPDVVVKVTTLPSADVAATALAGGSDDYANVVWASVLSQLPPGIGGSISAPGVPHTTVGAALAAWASANHALALLSAPAGSDATAAATAAGTAAAYTGAQNCVLAWPEVVVPAGVAQTKTLDPTIFAAACRMITHRDYGAGTSPTNRQCGQRIRGAVAPAFGLTAAQAQALLTARVSFAEILPSGFNPNNWVTLKSANANLAGAQYQDVVNCVGANGRVVLDAHIGQPANPRELAAVQGELEGVCAAYRPYLVAGYDAQRNLVHSGYVVSVSNGANLADNRISAKVSLKFGETIEWADFEIFAVDANGSI